MKATGVIRRIDELGRIVIPKEIRKTLRINSGDNLEIFLNDESIILKQFSAVKSIADFAQQLIDVIYNHQKKDIIITDTNMVIAASSNLKKSYIQKNISKMLINNISRREKIIEKYSKNLEIIEGQELNTKYILNSIISNGDVVGLVIIINEKEITDKDFEMSNIIADFLAKYLEC